MSLQTRFGLPIVAAATVVGAIRQTQRWLPRYEWVNAHQLGYYIAGINLTTLLVGIVGVFALGVRADRELSHRWLLSDALSTAIVAAVAGVAVGTTLAVVFQPGVTTISVGVVAPITLYTVTQAVPIGLAGVAGLASGRIHAIEHTEAGMAARSTDDQSMEPHDSSETNRREPAETDTDRSRWFEL